MSDSLELEKRVLTLEKTLGTLIVWIGQSSNSPLSITEATKLLHLLNNYDPLKEHELRRVK